MKVVVETEKKLLKEVKDALKHGKLHKITLNILS